MRLVLALAVSFLQPHGLPGCGDKPNPHCAMPDVPELRWRDTDRRYSWPPETNDPPFARITHHSNPAVYGTSPDGLSQRWCIVDEDANSIDCWSAWEIKAVSYCNTERWLWMAFSPFAVGATPRYRYENPELYHEHRAPLRVSMWEFGQFPTLPLLLPQRENPAVSAQVDRVQVLKAGPTIGFFTWAVYLIREKGAPLFTDSFAWTDQPGTYDGNATTSPVDEFQPAACQATYQFYSSACEFAPQRPECPR